MNRFASIKIFVPMTMDAVTLSRESKSLWSVVTCFGHFASEGGWTENCDDLRLPDAKEASERDLTMLPGGGGCEKWLEGVGEEMYGRDIRLSCFFQGRLGGVRKIEAKEDEGRL